MTERQPRVTFRHSQRAGARSMDVVNARDSRRKAGGGVTPSSQSRKPARLTGSGALGAPPPRGEGADSHTQEASSWACGRARPPPGLPPPRARLWTRLMEAQREAVGPPRSTPTGEINSRAQRGQPVGHALHPPAPRTDVPAGGEPGVGGDRRRPAVCPVTGYDFTLPVCVHYLRK